MAEQPSVAPTLPPYGEATLADLSTSILASLGAAGEANPLNLLRPTGSACWSSTALVGAAARQPGRRAVPVRAGDDARPLVAGFPGRP
jgi:hypothetical protein